MRPIYTAQKKIKRDILRTEEKKIMLISVLVRTG